MRSRTSSSALLVIAIQGLLAVTGCTVNETNDTASTTGQPTGSSSGGAGGEGAQGGGGAGGEGGTIINEDSGEDLCPGDPYDLDWGGTLKLSGTTATAKDDYKAFCGDQTPEVDAPDLVYAITLKQDGTFRATVETDGKLDPAVYVRSACDDEMTTTVCFDFGPKNETITGHYVAGTYYIFVDGSANTSGPFTLTVTLDEAKCGDGVVNPAEEVCDPLPPQPNDGCGDPGDPTYACKLEPPKMELDQCPGEDVALTTAGLTLLASDGHTTLNYSDNYTSSGCPAGTGGKDRVYKIVPATSGMMTASVGFEPDGTTSTCEQDISLAGCFDRVLYVRTTCDDTATELDCSDLGAADPEVIGIPVTAGTPYYVFVDGYDDASTSAGTYNLILTLQ